MIQHYLHEQVYVMGMEWLCHTGTPCVPSVLYHAATPISVFNRLRYAGDSVIVWSGDIKECVRLKPCHKVLPLMCKGKIPVFHCMVYGKEKNPKIWSLKKNLPLLLIDCSTLWEVMTHFSEAKKDHEHMLLSCFPNEQTLTKNAAGTILSRCWLYLGALFPCHISPCVSFV